MAALPPTRKELLITGLIGALSAYAMLWAFGTLSLYTNTGL